jgi:hypothetical protein
MTTRTIARLFDNYADAATVVARLEAAGFSDDDISIVASNADTRHTDGEAGPAGAGATAGTMIGGGLGLAAGLGALAIPGAVPVVAAGWLVATLTGAGVGAVLGSGAGGLIGALTHAGVSDDDAHVYDEGVRRGGTLVTVRTDAARVPQAEAILTATTYADPIGRRAEYKRAGWTRVDESAPPYAIGGTPETVLTQTTSAHRSTL